jgi:hypothetical protein
MGTTKETRLNQSLERTAGALVSCVFRMRRSLHNMELSGGAKFDGDQSEPGSYRAVV